MATFNDPEAPDPLVRHAAPVVYPAGRSDAYLLANNKVC